MSTAGSARTGRGRRRRTDAAGGARSVSLPVLGQGDSHKGGGAIGRSKTVARSKMGRWRAGVLILINVLIIAHIIQWLVTGMTTSPVEPSESMYTLERGKINAGFVLFALAILSTLILGRYFCGWACHIVALQDLCGWMMKKCGVRPKAFRSRLLLWVPLGLAIYMFVWPTFRREVLVPLIADETGHLPVWMGQAFDFPGLVPEFMVTDFWATFPPVWVAIPFLLICGFGAVYFLGAKGFCTYGCPYGGFFAPADRVAPGRIRVNDNCEHCGHCTTVCTSNVRVHEEVRDFGMIVDPGCMKCMDCVSVCPNDALYFGWGKPAAFAKPLNDEAMARVEKRRQSPKAYDLTKAEEFVILGLFLAMLFAFRGFWNEAPLLMAVAMAGVGAFCAWKLIRLIRDQNVRLNNFQLKLKGRLRPAGLVFVLLGGGYVLLGAWSFVVKYHIWQANLSYMSMEDPLSVVLRPEYAPTPEQAALARDAISHYQVAAPPNAEGGGIGWPLSGRANTQLAYLHLVLNEDDLAEEALRRLVTTGKPSEEAVGTLAALLQQRGASQEEVLAEYEDLLDRHPYLHGVRGQLAGFALQRSQTDAATAYQETGLKHNRRSPEAMLSAARHFLAIGEADRARTLMQRAIEDSHGRGDIYVNAGYVAAQLGDMDQALEFARQGGSRPPRDPNDMLNGAQLLLGLGRVDEALELADAATVRFDHRPEPFVRAGTIHARAGRAEGALEAFNQGVERLGDDHWGIREVGSGLVQHGVNLRSQAMIDRGVALLRKAVELEPRSPLLQHDLGLALAGIGDADGGVAALQRAAELAPNNAVLAARLAQLLAEVGRPDEAAEWRAEAERRAARTGSTE